MAGDIVCPQCGSTVSENTRFCSTCGYPIQAEFYQQTPSGRPAGVQPTQRMDEGADFSAFPPAAPIDNFAAEASPPKSRRPWLLLGGGLLLAVCCVAAGLFFVFSTILGDGSFEISLFSTDTPTPIPATATPTITPTLPPTNTPTPAPTDTPTPVPTQTEPEPTVNTGPQLTGNQRLSDTEFYDDFSSTALDWYVGSDADLDAGYESGAYTVVVKTTGMRQLIRPPLYPLSRIELTGAVVQGEQNGTFGVACYYVDVSDYFFVQFDTSDKSYRMGQSLGDEYKFLTDWLNYTSTTQHIRVTVDCGRTQMAVLVNNVPLYQLAVDKPNTPQEIRIFAGTWSDAGGSIKVYFDDIYGVVSTP